MPRVSYKQAASLFGHIDADVIELKFEYPGDELALSLSYYPYWLHPRFAEGHAGGNPFGRIDWETAKRTVDIHAIGVRELSFSPSSHIVDLQITADHALLWKYEACGQITSNAPLSINKAVAIAKHARQMLNMGATLPIAEILDFELVDKYGDTPSFSLGHFPRPAYWAVRKALDDVGHPYFTSYEPPANELPVALVSDDGHVIADDFQIDMPEFEHRPEWYAETER